MSITPICQIISRHIYIYKHDTVIKNNKFYSRKTILNKNSLPDILDIFKTKAIFLSECTFEFDEGNESRKQHFKLLKKVTCNSIYFVISSIDLFADRVFILSCAFSLHVVVSAELLNFQSDLQVLNFLFCVVSFSTELL